MLCNPWNKHVSHDTRNEESPILLPPVEAENPRGIEEWKKVFVPDCMWISSSYNMYEDLELDRQAKRGGDEGPFRLEGSPRASQPSPDIMNTSINIKSVFFWGNKGPDMPSRSYPQLSLLPWLGPGSLLEKITRKNSLVENSIICYWFFMSAVMKKQRKVKGQSKETSGSWHNS